ncbi:Glycerol-3-phosphate acyltransferase 5 [Hibiscus syriacus]|uniref:RING-type E3 ubiquitin transferase n=1 Tax=Hibiscus syriacus TaxID=106335 RepID=A0A6A2YCF3_HIBSY|nr:Glycerol-3-phosphate acyltransferase 5 [Hibiscus syriacus]
MAMATSYWCYRCNRIIRLLNQDAVSCPDCRGGFIEEIVLPFSAVDDVMAAIVLLSIPSSCCAAERFRPSLPRLRLAPGEIRVLNRMGEDSRFTTTTEPGRVFGRCRLACRIFFWDPGFDRLIDQLSQMEIHNTGRNEQPPASKAAVEAIPTVEINESHMHGELCCAVCKEQFEIGTKVKNMPCDHLYHSNCILPWLQLRNSCPVCRHELPVADGQEGSVTGDGYSNPSEEVPLGLTIWRLPGGGFAVGRFSGGIRGGGGENRDFPVVYTEVDGGFSGGGLTRRVSWGNRSSRGRERRGVFRRTFRSLLGCFSGSNSSNSRSISR